MMESIIENTLIKQLTREFRRSPVQQNGIHESDAELLQISSNGMLLAVTTDTIAEEIALGLYNDPYLAGWMIVMANMSDLAAVGAKPVGILLSELMPTTILQEETEQLQRGIRDACEACNTFVLGGDTNFSDKLILTGCAIGTVSAKNVLTRRGTRPGDLVYSTGTFGLGNAFALSCLIKTSRSLTHSLIYKPRARLHEGHSICGIASACMDTSDGMLATIDQLMRLNEVGFRIDAELNSYLHHDSLRVAERNAISPWLMLAGLHGEFELIFTVPPDRETVLLASAGENGWIPVRLGVTTRQQGIQIKMNNTMISLDTARIRNLMNEANGDVVAYLNKLFALDKEIQKGVLEHDTTTL